MREISDHAGPGIPEEDDSTYRPLFSAPNFESAMKLSLDGLKTGFMFIQPLFKLTIERIQGFNLLFKLNVEFLDRGNRGNGGRMDIDLFCPDTVMGAIGSINPVLVQPVPSTLNTVSTDVSLPTDKSSGAVELSGDRTCNLA